MPFDLPSYDAWKCKSPYDAKPINPDPPLCDFCFEPVGECGCEEVEEQDTET